MMLHGYNNPSEGLLRQVDVLRLQQLPALSERGSDVFLCDMT